MCIHPSRPATSHLHAPAHTTSLSTPHRHLTQTAHPRSLCVPTRPDSPSPNYMHPPTTHLTRSIQSVTPHVRLGGVPFLRGLSCTLDLSRSLLSQKGNKPIGEMTRVGPPVRPVWKNVAKAGANHLGRGRCLHPCLSPPSLGASVCPSIYLFNYMTKHALTQRTATDGGGSQAILDPAVAEADCFAQLRPPARLTCNVSFHPCIKKKKQSHNRR